MELRGNIVDTFLTSTERLCHGEVLYRSKRWKFDLKNWTGRKTFQNIYSLIQVFIRCNRFAMFYNLTTAFL